MHEVAGDAALLVDPNSVEDIGSALARLASEVALRDGLIQRGRARASQFTWESAVRRTWAVYETVMAGR